MTLENEMSVPGQLIDWMQRQSGLAGLVGDRFYPVEAPQQVPAPYVVVQEVFADRFVTSDGPGGLGRFGLQVDIYAEKYSQATALAEVLRRGLHAYQGPMGSVFCQLAEITTGFSQRLTEPELTRVSRDVTLTFTELYNV